ncbi:bacillithiol transferase BstA [Paenibacillus sp. JCM 10914]|uniref:YfiT family bacillithiol transferase n=1 Tax=Paenibacillus sp. JCM 10914 TaxID=1236974 RepID=UPI0003CC6BF7|nr:putative metal-dependent hydrolase BCE33L2441 [Paenibacillus sp. JCM 10914]
MDLRYPIGPFVPLEPPTRGQLHTWIRDIDELPDKLHQAVKGLTNEQLDIAYRDGGWTIRQVVHHVADSHINSYIRFKLALTEDNPTIKPYDENKWATLHDAMTMDIEPSLQLIEGTHARWISTLSNMGEYEFKRTFYHPGLLRETSLAASTGMYAWHGKHHTAHITSVRERLGI